jgi:hypothetical protein
MMNLRSKAKETISSSDLYIVLIFKPLQIQAQLISLLQAHAELNDKEET